MINENMTIAEAMEKNPQVVGKIFFSYGMGCLGCAMASGETIKEACEHHGINVDEIIAKLNEALN